MCERWKNVPMDVGGARDSRRAGTWKVATRGSSGGAGGSAPGPAPGPARLPCRAREVRQGNGLQPGLAGPPRGSQRQWWGGVYGWGFSCIDIHDLPIDTPALELEKQGRATRVWLATRTQFSGVSLFFILRGYSLREVEHENDFRATG